MKEASNLRVPQVSQSIQAFAPWSLSSLWLLEGQLQVICAISNSYMMEQITFHESLIPFLILKFSPPSLQATMRNFRPIIAFALICFLSSAISIIFCEPNTLLCNEEEKRALLRFKQALSDPGSRLSSWSINQDCCTWESVRCNNVTRRVVELQLGGFGLGGEISPALLELEFLSYLNLGGNDFGGNPIPNFLGSMRSLRYLDLSGASFGGRIPHQLGNLSSLRHLDLGYNLGLSAENLDWISNLSFLKYLSMDGVDLRMEVDWLECVSMLPSLSELHLFSCHLHKIMFSPLGYVNLSSLTVLELSVNDFNQKMPNWLFNISASLSSLGLSESGWKGQISESIGQLKYLELLDISFNSFHGPIPTSIGNLSSLRSLIINGNRLINGTLPVSLGFLSNLKGLVMGETSLTGTISEVHFTALSKLIYLQISETSLSFHVNSSWTPPFQLEYLDAFSCEVGPKFPAWLQTQKSLFYLRFSSSGIRDITPKWFWKWASNIPEIHLSNNQISGDLSHVVLKTNIIDLSSNCFTGLLPRLSPDVVVLNLANNSCSGQISRLLCQTMNGTGKLEVLDISNNALSGELSDCWMRWPALTHISLGSNRLSGTIPNSMGFLVGLEALGLHKNSLDGELPPSLEKCKALGLINLSHNKFSGTIPGWIAERITLMIINLRSNEFMGNIPQKICHLSYLSVLDLANNSLSGTIPDCLNNISVMAEGPITGNFDVKYKALEAEYDYASYTESVILNIKGRDSNYKETLGLVKAMDLSINNFSGSIPIEIFSLTGLQSLNLSHNNLTGSLSMKIGGMEFLESLDLSRNHLSGEIPPAMANLTFLSYLDLSYNNFSGTIPSSTQLQSLNPLSFVGNAELCGPPLTKNCTGDEETPALAVVEESGRSPETAWFYLGMGPGFIAGFWGVCGLCFCRENGGLLISSLWRTSKAGCKWVLQSCCGGSTIS